MSKQKSISTKINAVQKQLADISEQESKLAKEKDELVSTVVNGLQGIIQSSKFFSHIKWDQYTPYFNDGDVCSFGVHEMRFVLSEEGAAFLNDNNIKSKYIESWDTEEEHELYDLQGAFEHSVSVIDYQNPEFATLKAIHKELDDVSDFLQQNEDSLERIFEDHSTVTVSRSGIEIDSCEHD